VFAIEAIGTRVAEVAASPQGPRVVLAAQLAGEAPILVHRTPDLDTTLAELGARADSSRRPASSRRSAPA
jgi:hypothetical protein